MLGSSMSRTGSAHFYNLFQMSLWPKFNYHRQQTVQPPMSGPAANVLVLVPWLQPRRVVLTVDMKDVTVVL